MRLGILMAAVLLAPAAALPAAAQDPPPPPPADHTLSMGLPATWRPEIGAGFYLDHDDGAKFYGAELRGSLYRPLINPVMGVGLQVDGLVRAVDGTRPGGAVRLSIPIRYLGLAWGWEYDFGRGTVQPVFSISTPLRRGGLFGQGDRFHLDLSGSTFRAGFTFPLRGWMGTSRPTATRATLPDPPRPLDVAEQDRRALEARLADLRIAARWVNDYTTPFIDQWSSGRFLAGVDELKEAIDQPDALFPGGHTFIGAIDAYHRELTRAFTAAVGGDAPLGEQVTAEVRRVLLDDVILPYDRLLGQRKRHDSLNGLGVGAASRLSQALSGRVTPDQATAVVATFRAVIDILERNRRHSRGLWDDGRLVWVPLHYALRLEDHDSQQEIDAVIERAVEKPFTDGNQVSYVVNQQFHIEVARQIREARDYHVLWIHDFKGKNAAGDPDPVGFEFAVNVYLKALTGAVREYDQRGVMTQYIILLDQWFYGGSDAARWMKLLQDPLDHELHLPKDFAPLEHDARTVQDELRAAVAGSARLQAGLKAYGRGWLKNQVKVHVNITNPADPSFTSAHMLSWLVLLPDDMYRDHRKIAFYDVTEEDPARGQAIFAGMGIAQHYTGNTWEDRGVMVRGPAVLEVKAEARGVLLQQGFSEDEIPRGLKPRPRAADYDAKVAALRQAGGLFHARAMQVHNATGYGQKWSSVARAMLYDLMPAGATIFIPDSLWNSPLWASMLVGNALRGARVFVVAPAKKNAPGSGALVMSRAHEVFTRFVLVQERLRGPIERAGGSLRTGVYDPDGPIDLVKELGKVIASARNLDPALHAAFPFDPSLAAEVEKVRDELVASGFTMAVLAPDAETRDPKIHLKSQLLVSREALESLVPRPDVVPLVARYIQLRAELLSSLEGNLREASAEMEAASAKTIADWWAGLPDATREKAVALLAVGSNNMDLRGQVMDGEVTMIVAGLEAMSSYLNTYYVASVTTWVNSVDELSVMIPGTNGLVRWLARYAKYAL